ncbi:MAG: VOC family protein [Acidimicrobiales bacterium]
MPTRDQAPLGAPCWIDLLTSDPDSTRPFYEELFGWKAEEANPDFGGYFSFLRDGQPIAGGMRNDGQAGTADQWNVYLATAEADATTRAVTDYGGQVYSPAMAVMDLGTMAVLGDPGGAMISTWQPGTHPGFTTLAEPGAPAWFELHTRDYDKAVRFYQDVFGWETQVASDTPDFRYTTFVCDVGPLAGIMDDTVLPSDSEVPHWAVYFQVEDTDAAVGQATELGGSVIHDPTDSPFGRLATLADPTGAQFRVTAP